MSEPSEDSAKEKPEVAVAEPATQTPLSDRPVRALPVIAVCAVLLTAAAILVLGRASPPSPASLTHVERAVGDPDPVRDTDHYVPGSPPAVAERFLRAWMRGRYDEARELATGEARARAERELQEVASFTPEQRDEFRRTRAYVDATRYELEHVTMEDLPPGPDGRARKRVRGQARATGDYRGTHVDSRRGQTFTLEMVEGSWRVSERTWETFERDR